MTLPRWECLQTFAASTFGGQIDGGAAVYIAAGDYYWRTGVSESVNVSLRAAFQTLLAATVGGTTVTLDVSTSSPPTGKLTIEWGSGSHTFTWASTAIRDRCGFAGNLASSSGETGTLQVQGLWLPNVQPSGLEASVATNGYRDSDRRICESRSGAITKVMHNERTRNTLRFDGLTKAKTWTANEAITNESAESFWAFGMGGTICAPFRYHADRSTDGTYLTYHDLIRKGFRPTPRKANYDGSWIWEVPVGKYVHLATGGGR